MFILIHHTTTSGSLSLSEIMTETPAAPSSPSTRTFSLQMVNLSNRSYFGKIVENVCENWQKFYKIVHKLKFKLIKFKSAQLDMNRPIPDHPLEHLEESPLRVGVLCQDGGSWSLAESNSIQAKPQQTAVLKN